MQFLFTLLALCIGVSFCPVQAQTSKGERVKKETSVQYPASSPNYKKFSSSEPPLLPTPQKLLWGKSVVEIKGVSLSYPKMGGTVDLAQSSLLKQEMKAYLFAHEVSMGTKGFPLKFVVSTKEKLGENPEAYELKITPEGCIVRAAGSKGFYYAWKTLRQLLVRREGKTTFPVVSIEDYPKFEIRGLMNDTGRNYMDISLIKSEVDAMADYKMNVYHFHFTDNHGWRLESKKYPQLQAESAFTRKAGKFYTQKVFKEFLEYCRVRNVIVIPEMDLPGHTLAFRKAFNVESMEDPKAVAIACDLIKELASLAPCSVMPYINIGTDEAREKSEQVSQETLKKYFATVYDAGRQAIRWQPGLSVKGDNKPIQQMWSGRAKQPTPGASIIDSQENYVNHLDPFEMVMTNFFRKNCATFPKAGKGLGGILCSWPDLYMEDEKAHLTQTPIFPGIVSYCDSVWKDGRDEDELIYYSNLPVQGDEKLKEFSEFEDKLVAHRDRFFRNKPFAYVRQSNIPWKIIGPFPNNNKPETIFPVEEGIKSSYEIDGQTYTWSESDYTGATIIFKHYCDYPNLFSPQMGRIAHPKSTYYALTYIWSPKDQTVPFWVSGHFWPTSDFRDGPVSVPGKWFHTSPQFFVNGKALPAPEWKVPNRNKGNDKLPLVDENWSFRTPTSVALKKGWNEILIKSPHSSQARRWMFTFVPVMADKNIPVTNCREFPGLKFSTHPKK